MKPRATPLILLCALPTLVFVGALLFYPQRDFMILWPRDFSLPPATLAVIAAVVAAYAAAAAAILLPMADALSARRRWALLALVVLGGLALQMVITLATEPDPIVAIVRRTFAWKAGGYYTVGAPVTDLRDFIGRYAERAPLYPVHQARHPPGLALIFWLGARVFDALPALALSVAAWLRPNTCLSLLPVDAPAPQMAAGLFGALAEIGLAMLVMLPLHALVRRLAGPRAAAWSIALYSLMPGFGMWVGQFDRGLALATAIVLYFCERLISERKLRFALWAGLTLSIATFASFGAVPIGLIAAAYALARLAQRIGRDAPAWRAQAGFIGQSAGLAVLGALSVWAFTWAWAGLNPIRLYNVIFDSHLGIDFPFWPFVVWHPWDLLTMLGLPIAAVAALAGWRRAPALTAAFVIPLVTLSLAHVARGETGRVWLYFAPAAVGAAGIVLAGAARRAQVMALGLLALQLVVQGAVMRVQNEYGTPPEQYPNITIPPDAVPLDTRFGASGQIALLAYRVEPLQRGADRPITLYWQRMSAEPLQTNFSAFVHVATDESDQARVAQSDSMPVREYYPTTCWQAGQVVADTHYLATALSAGPGQYPIFVGLYDPLKGERPPTFASPPARQMYGSVLLPGKAAVR